MEESEIRTEELSLNSIYALVFIEIMNICTKILSQMSSLSTDPLFSSIITFYTLFLLYFPQIFLRIVFSPVIIITAILLLTLLRLGSIQRLQIESKENNETEEIEGYMESNATEPEKSDTLHEVHKWVASQTITDSETETGFDPNPGFEETFVEWNVRAPLDVIYEAYEGEEEEEDPNEKDPNPNENQENTRFASIERYPSLSLYYPESDSDTSSDGDFPAIGDWVSPEKICFRWEEEDREGLIEIALDGNKREFDFHGEEENLIEIDITPVKNDEFTSEKQRFPVEELGSVNVDYLRH